MSIKYVHQLPYHERRELCLFLDMNDQWKELGGRFLGIDFRLLDRYDRLSQSPTDSILLEWGSRNGTILKLFGYLYKMHNFQAMRILKPFVDPEYHRYIREEDSNLSFSSITEFSTGGNRRSPSNPSVSSNRNVRRNPTDIPAASQSSSQRRSESGSGETRPTLETILTRISLEACSLHIPYSELEQATSNWNKARILGKGGFGVVFNGSWKNTAVAIKRLESQRSNDPHYNNAEVQRQQSLRELKYLNNYKHDNILPLYGYSIDGEKPCLVYQLMSNGSLEDRLQCRRGTKALSWWQRVHIANGSARGLQFLHSMDVPLIHGDIKSANILLDSNFVPKLGDFGLAKEGPVRDITHVEITKVQGTKPYLPPEFLRGRKLSVKVDTYGFGVVLCELATGLRAYDESRNEKFLRDHCHEAESDNRLENLKDPKATPEEDYFYTSLIKLGINCTKITARERPLMADVLKDLDNVSDLRRRPSIDRRPSLPVSNSYQFHHLFLTPNPSNHQRPLSTSPSRSVLPQVPEITQECRTYESNIISPSVQHTPILSQNRSNEPTQSVLPRNENNSDTSTSGTIDDDFGAEGNESTGSEPPIPCVSKLL